MASAVFGIVGSSKGGIWCSDGDSGLAYVARAEDVVLWDLKKGEIVREFKVGNETNRWIHLKLTSDWGVS